MLLEQDTIRKRQVNKTLPEPEREFQAENNKNYKVESIVNNIIYNKEIKSQMLGLYYLVLSIGYLDKKSTWEPLIAIMHL